MNVKTKHKLLFRYLIAGVISYAIEITFLLFLKKIIGLSGEVSTAISFWIGLIAAFLIQKMFAFKNQNKDTKEVGRQAVIYAGLVLFNYIFTILVVTIAPENMLLVARTTALVVTTLWNFVFYKKFIFKNS